MSASSGGSVTWANNLYNAGKFSSYTPASSEWTKNSALPQPQPGTDIPSADNSGPAWRRPTTPTETLNVLPSATRSKKEILDGQVVIITTDPVSGTDNRYSVSGRKL
jgi:hypothetical protein